MKKITEAILKKISVSQVDDIYDELDKLAYIITMNCRGVLPDDPDLHSEKLSDQELDKVKKTLMNYIKNNKTKKEIADAFYCLCMFFDKDLKEFFVDYLHYFYKRAVLDLKVMGQIENCLFNLDEEIFDEWAYDEYEKNLNDTKNYLRKIGKIT